MWTAVDNHRNIEAREITYLTDATFGQSGGFVIEDNYTDCQHCAIAVHRGTESSGSEVYNVGVKVNDVIFNMLYQYRFAQRIYMPNVWR